jgi:hypothetical protein
MEIGYPFMFKGTVRLKAIVFQIVLTVTCGKNINHKQRLADAFFDKRTTENNYPMLYFRQLFQNQLYQI